MTSPSAEALSAPAAPAASLPRWKRVLFTTVLLVVVWVLLEVIARVYLVIAQGYDGKHLYQYDFDSYRNIVPAANYVDRRGIRHNAQHFRRDENVSVQKPPGTYRIFLMGASTAYGLGGLWPHIQKDYAVLRNDQTIDHYLEVALRRALPGRRIEVINAAVTSTWTHHHLIGVNEDILRYQPDMVLLLDGFNDYFFSDTTHNQFGDYAYAQPARSIMGAPTIGSLMYGIGWWLFRKSAVAHVIGRGLRLVKLAVTPQGNRTPLDVARASADWERIFARSALAMHRRTGLILRDAGVVPVFMLQPLLILERDRPGAPAIERKLFDFNVSSYRPNYEAFMRTVVPIAHEREAAMAKEIGANYIDLTHIYDAAPPGQIFTDYAHLTPRGNEILADTVAQRILPLIGATPSPCTRAEWLRGGCQGRPERDLLADSASGGSVAPTAPPSR